MKKYNRLCYAIVISYFFTLSAFAQLEIDISGGEVRGIPIAIIPFHVAQNGVLPHQIDQVVVADLSATGKFEILSPINFLSFPHKDDQVYYKDWRQIGAELLVMGEIWPISENNFEVRFYLFDIARQQKIGNGRRIRNVKVSDLRTVAHIISDTVYRDFLQKKGAFTSKIAYVNRKAIDASNFRYEIMVADWDGYGAKTVYSTSNPLLALDWSPDAKKVAFVSVGKRRSMVKYVDISQGAVTTVANFTGINNAPSWSPDGKKIAYSSSKFGNSDIYIYDTMRDTHKKMTTHYGIDTEPDWSNNGKKLIFTSNRAGKPQIYELDVASESVIRKTFTKKENASAQYDDAGNMILVYDGGSIRHVAAKSNRQITITNGKFDESPSFSPNADMILYATELNSQPVLMVSSSDGRVHTRLDFIRGDIREPAWSPR